MPGQNAPGSNRYHLDLICEKNGTFRGYLIPEGSEERKCFQDINELVRELLKILDKKKLPKQTTQLRAYQQREVEQMEDQEEREAHFLINIMYRRNSTWQGTVRWLEEEETQSFRSALELIKILDSAFQQQEDSRNSSSESETT